MTIRNRGKKGRILRDVNGKAKSFKLRISPEELEALKGAAERTRMSAAQYLRQLLRVAVGLPTGGAVDA